MSPLKTKLQRSVQRWEVELQMRFERVLPYYRERGGVVFLSYCQFWEPHGFVQQSLARYLTENRVKVTWLDAAGWRSYHPTLYWDSPHLNVYQISRLPGERIPAIRSLSVQLQAVQIRKALNAHGGNPILWVQAGVEDGIAESLPYIDVFSTFDDPYRHQASDPLCERARLVICQNRYTESLLLELPANRRVQLPPPVDMRGHMFSDSKFLLPGDFPKRVMGYIGSFLQGGYDFFMLEYLIRTLPEWGFLIMGRTDKEGARNVERLKSYPNFLSVPWAERSKLAGVWSKIDVSLLLYRNHPLADGAFPVKLIEGLSFGVPAVGTQVNKNRDIAEDFPCRSFADQVVESALEVADWSLEKVEGLYDHYRRKMDPRVQLCTVSERLSKASSFLMD